MRKITEDHIQAEIVIWYTNNHCLRHQKNRGLIFAIPNGSFRNIREAVKLKNTGTLAGASDLIVILPSGLLLFVECKTDTGRQGPAQKEFAERVEALGYKYHLVRSLEEFKDLIPLP